MSKNYIPSLEELSRDYGERYFTLEVGKRHRPHEAYLMFGTLEDIISIMDATIYGIDPNAAALARLGIRFHRGATATEYDGDVCEIVDRRDGMPLFCAIPQEV